MIAGNLADAQVAGKVGNLLNDGIFKAKKDGKCNENDANSQRNSANAHIGNRFRERCLVRISNSAGDEQGEIHGYYFYKIYRIFDHSNPKRKENGNGSKLQVNSSIVFDGNARDFRASDSRGVSNKSLFFIT